jgi:hypothetical protein
VREEGRGKKEEGRRKKEEIFVLPVPIPNPSTEDLSLST